MERWLLFIFFLSLAILNPWVRGDGVGYYAFARAPLIEHNFNFEQDYVSANTGIREARLDEHGRPMEPSCSRAHLARKCPRTDFPLLIAWRWPSARHSGGFLGSCSHFV